MKNKIIKALSIVLTSTIVLGSTCSAAYASETDFNPVDELLQVNEVVPDIVVEEEVIEEASDEYVFAEEGSYQGSDLFTAIEVNSTDSFTPPDVKNICYVYTAPEAGTVSFKMIPNSSDQNKARDYILYDSSKTKLFRARTYSNNKETVRVYCDKGEKIYFELTGQGVSDYPNLNGLTCEVNFQNGNWAKRTNKDLLSAEKIEIGEQKKGCLFGQVNNDQGNNIVDYFSITLPTKGKYNFLKTGEGVGIALLDSNGQEVYDEYKLMLGSIRECNAGNYFIKVSCGMGTEGNIYSLAVLKGSSSSIVETENYAIKYIGISQNNLVGETVLPKSFVWKSKGMKAVKLPSKNEKQLYKEGYKFKGFYNEENRKVTSIGKKYKRDVTLTAVWTVNKYSVKFKKVKPEGTKSVKYSDKLKTINTNYEQTITLPNVTAETKDGIKYELIAWEDKNGVKYEAGKPYKGISGKNSKDKSITLKPVWKKAN